MLDPIDFYFITKAPYDRFHKKNTPNSMQMGTLTAIPISMFFVLNFNQLAYSYSQVLLLK